VLFNDTIFYNIAYGNVHATKQEVEEAARMADLEKVILRMPLGYETQVYSAYLYTSCRKRCPACIVYSSNKACT
jgi:ABC-type transport system involved in Fe-S cluster assembly fused permease/ATPase subunit